jgi:hypothetical protein
LNDWKGETNSQFGTLLKKKFTSLYPRVGVGIMIFKDGKVLMGKRKGKHGAGEYAWPGGHFRVHGNDRRLCKERSQRRDRIRDL